MKHRKPRMVKAWRRALLRQLCKAVLRRVVERIVADMQERAERVKREAARMESQLRYGTDTPPEGAA